MVKKKNPLAVQMNKNDLIMSKSVPAIKSYPPQQKLDQALYLYWSVQDLKNAWLKQQHPDMTDKQISRKIAILFKDART